LATEGALRECKDSLGHFCREKVKKEKIDRQKLPFLEKKS
jgi:hypothetical protein